MSKLWQESVKIIDIFENELKVYQGGYENFVPKKDYQMLKRMYEKKIQKLEEKLNSSETKLEEAKNKIESKHYEVDQSLETQIEALKIVKNLEGEILTLQHRLKITGDEKIQLERVIGEKEHEMQNLKQLNQNYLNRVSEALNCVEAALNEKDAAIYREQETKKENEKIVEEMTEFVIEFKKKIIDDRNTLESVFSAKEVYLTENLEKANKEIHDKNNKIDSLNKKIAVLENEIDRIHKGHCSLEERDSNKLLILEKNLESTFQKLLLSEKQNIQLISEKEALNRELEQMAGIYEKNLKAKEIEIATLKIRTMTLQQEFESDYGQMNGVKEQMIKVNEQISKSEKEKYEKSLEEKMNYLAKKYNENIKELQMQIDKKNEINNQWRQESKLIITNLEKIISKLKHEFQIAKNDNKNLKENFKKSDAKTKQYRLFLDLISKDLTNITQSTLEKKINK
ncbi:hypothetical protein ABEB36_013924 [Hypothenemus hampei]|uniref:Uncharacterized protein n=1 Tax=Hypothenemus hampei TaxID=57062 RepID=A0ABD1E8E8_HYPHA